MAKKGFTLWFTGMSGSGKSTLAEQCRDILLERGLNVEVLVDPLDAFDVADRQHGSLEFCLVGHRAGEIHRAVVDGAFLERVAEHDREALFLGLAAVLGIRVEEHHGLAGGAQHGLRQRRPAPGHWPRARRLAC